MKIRRIFFKNINSFKGEHTIDFTASPLSGAGIFAITGPTGSGKSTLLDVISLALFNNVPRLNETKLSENKIEKSGSIVTRNTSEAYAAVEYECNAGVFISKWSLSKNKNNKWRPYDLELSDEDGAKFPISKAEVPAKNEELIGLNYSQFVKSVVLAQGEFARFLKAPKAERGELLEKITGTEIYRQLGQKAFEKFTQQGQALEALQNQLKSSKDDQLSEDDMRLLYEQFGNKENELLTLNEELEKINGAIETKHQINELEKSIDNTKKEITKKEEEKQEFETQNNEKLRLHEELLIYEEELLYYRTLSSHLNDLEIKKAKITTGISENKIQLMASLTRASTLVKKELILEEAEEELRKLKQEVNRKLAEGNTVNSELSPLLQNVKKVASEFLLMAPEQLDLEWKETVINKQAELQSSHKTLVNYFNPEELIDLEHTQDNIIGQITNVTKWQGLENKLRDKEEAEKQLTQDLEKDQDQIKVLEKEIKELTGTDQIGAQELKILKDSRELQRLRAKYEDDRQNLKSGEPCPLCGSLDHPFIDTYERQEDGLDEKIISKENEIRNVNDQLSRARSSKDHLTTHITLYREKIELLAVEIKDLRSEMLSLKEFIVSEDVAISEEYIQQLQEKRKKVAQVNSVQIQLKQIEELVQNSSDTIELQEKTKKISEDIQRIYTGQDIDADCDSCVSSINRLSAQLKSYDDSMEENKSEEDSKTRELAELSCRLKPELEKVGFISIEEAFPCILKAVDYNALITQKNTLDREIKILEDRIDSFSGQLMKFQKNDSDQPLEELANLKQQILERRNSEKEKRDELLARKTRQEMLIETILELEEKITLERGQNEKWVLLKEYIGDAKGNKFANFAQQLTLKHLVGLANHQMANLTKRYLLDLPNEDIEDDNLVIVDNDQGGVRRSVKTLSGGESFITSLALALALSDLASKSVEIKSLFIDEGFGTLDPDTLEVVLAMLENLQAENNKTIGVISHVDILKERIATKINVIPNGQGNSFLTIDS